MDFEMSGREKLEAAVSRLRGAGFEDASQAESGTGQATYVLSVTVDSEEDERLVSDLVHDVDPSDNPS